MSIATVLGWKFNQAPGIKTVDGVLTQWPGSLGTVPTQAQIDTWTTEYDTYMSGLATIKQQKAQAVIDNLPTWAQVNTAITNIANLADAKAFIAKLARIVYILAKDSLD